jgi:hypothetical protein
VSFARTRETKPLARAIEIQDCLSAFPAEVIAPAPVAGFGDETAGMHDLGWPSDVTLRTERQI